MTDPHSSLVESTYGNSKKKKFDIFQGTSEMTNMEII